MNHQLPSTDRRLDEQLSSNQLLEMWLHSESSDDEAAAEQTLAMLVASLPAPAPGRDFAERVLERAGLADARTRSREWRAAIAAAVVATLALGTWLALLIAGRLSFARSVEAVGDAFAALGRVAIVTTTLWNGLVRVGDLTREVAMTSEALLAIAALCLLSVAAYTTLSALLERNRHVEA